jgi:hypothetical protein
MFVNKSITQLFIIATLALGSRPRQRFVRAQAKSSVRECEDDDSHSQMSSHFGSWSPGGLPNLQRVIAEVKTPRIEEFFISLEKLLKCRCLKWARMTHLDIYNTSYSKKKGWESNWQFESRPQNVKNRPDFRACRWCATHRWKALDESYNFALDLVPIGGLNAKL